MKKLISFALILTLTLALCACSDISKTEPTPTPEQTAEPAATPEPSAEPEKPELSDTGKQLVEILDKLKTDCHPGTAGSSLTGAALAAELLDWAAENPDDIDEQALLAAQSFKELLTSDESALIEDQLSLVYGESSELLGEDGELLLESCGYDAAHFPYDAGTAQQLFAALYDGMGLEMK